VCYDIVTYLQIFTIFGFNQSEWKETHFKLNWVKKYANQKKQMPKYIHTKVSGNKCQCEKTKEAAIWYRLNQLIKNLSSFKLRNTNLINDCIWSLSSVHTIGIIYGIV
jgi:hypothetical protein